MLTFGRGVMVLAEGGTFRFVDRWPQQELTEASLRDAWLWLKSAPGRAFDWVGGLLAPLWDAFLDRMSGAELIAKLDVADDWAEAMQIRNKLREQDAAKVARSGWGTQIAELIADAAVTIGRTITWPSRAFAQYINANPDAAGLIVVYGAITAMAAAGGAAAGIGTLLPSVVAAVPGILTLAAQILIRRSQKDKPRKTGFGARRNFLTGAPHSPYETTYESMYVWDDHGSPLEEGVLDSVKAVLQGMATAWKFPPRMIQAWAEEKMRAAGAEPGAAPDPTVVQGLTQDIIGDLERLPDDLERAGINPESRSFKLGMTMTRALWAPIRAILEPIWSVIANAIPGLADYTSRFELPSLRLALPFAFIFGAAPGVGAGMVGGPSAATAALISMGLPLSAVALVMGGFMAMGGSIASELARETKNTR